MRQVAKCECARWPNSLRPDNKVELKKYLDDVKENNKYYKNSTQWIKEKYTIKIEVAKDRFRKNYIINSLDKSYKSYSKYKLTFLKNHLEKVA